MLSAADALVLTEVYPAGEVPIAGADGRSLARAIRARGEIDPVFAADLDEARRLLPGLVREGDVLLVMGAGDVGRLARELAGGEEEP